MRSDLLEKSSHWIDPQTLLLNRELERNMWWTTWPTKKYVTPLCHVSYAQSFKILRSWSQLRFWHSRACARMRTNYFFVPIKTMLEFYWFIWLTHQFAKGFLFSRKFPDILQHSPVDPLLETFQHPFLVLLIKRSELFVIQVFLLLFYILMIHDGSNSWLSRSNKPKQ